MRNRNMYNTASQKNYYIFKRNIFIFNELYIKYLYNIFALNYSYTERTILLRKSKILLDTDLKIILLNHQNNFVGTLKITSNAAKNFDILAISLSVVHNYFDNSTKLLF